MAKRARTKADATQNEKTSATRANGTTQAATKANGTTQTAATSRGKTQTATTSRGTTQTAATSRGTTQTVTTLRVAPPTLTGGTTHRITQLAIAPQDSPPAKKTRRLELPSVSSSAPVNNSTRSASGTHASQPAVGGNRNAPKPSTQLAMNQRLTTSSTTGSNRTVGTATRNGTQYSSHAATLAQEHAALFLQEYLYPGIQNQAERKNQWISANTMQYKYKQSSKGSGDEREKCNVCLAEFETGESVRRLLCLHVFHSKCVENWVWEHKKCPYCRTNFHS